MAGQSTAHLSGDVVPVEQEGSKGAVPEVVSLSSVVRTACGIVQRRSSGPEVLAWRLQVLVQCARLHAQSHVETWSEKLTGIWP